MCDVGGRTHIGAEGFASHIKEFAIQHGKSFLKYDETKEVNKCKTDVPAIQKGKAFLQLLKKKSNKLHFVRSEVKAGLGLVFQDLSASWHMSDEVKEDYIETMCRRCMNVTHVVGHALSKGPMMPKWCKELELDIDE